MIKQSEFCNFVSSKLKMRRSTLIMILCCMVPPTILGVCSKKNSPEKNEIPAPRVLQEPVAQKSNTRELMPDTVSAYSSRLPMMEEGEIAQPIRVRYFGHNYAKVFDDKNDVQMPHAIQNGINRLTDMRSYWQNTRGMEAVVSCRDYYVDQLTHSRAVLVPEAKAMLHEIGRRFCDSLRVRGGGNYRIKVTSLTRTEDDVKRLRKVNVNSVAESTHFFGTTVDISHADFVRDPGGEPRTVDNLKGVLSEVLYAMRDEGKCCVLFERRQQCFHVTVCAHPSYTGK